MAITIGNLKYQDTDSAIYKYMRETFSWLRNVSVLNGVSGKATVNGVEITGSILTAADCTLDSRNTELVAKEVELDYYNLSFPVSHCDLHRTWLSAFANKYRNEEDVYVDSLIPYLAEKVGDEVRVKVFTDVLAEALADADVTKVTLAGLIDTPVNAYGTVQEFIDGLPAALYAEAVDKESWQYYSVSVSPAVYKLVRDYLGDKVSAYGLTVNGLNVVADKTLSGKSMYCTTDRNILVAFDSSEDLAEVKIVAKEWLNTSYIITGLGFKGSYVDSKEIVISN